MKNSRQSKKKLSQHDIQLLEQINEIDRRWGYLRWLDISALAEQLEDKQERERWNRTCISYNHTEEYFAMNI